MNTDIDGKVSRAELDALREYLEKQLKKLKRLAVSASDGSTSVVICLCTQHWRVKRFSLIRFLVRLLSVFVSCFVLMKKDPQPGQQQQHAHIMSEDEAAGLRKQLVRFHCISCDRPIDVQPHPFVSFVTI